MKKHILYRNVYEQAVRSEAHTSVLEVEERCKGLSAEAQAGQQPHVVDFSWKVACMAVSVWLQQCADSHEHVFACQIPCVILRCGAPGPFFVLTKVKSSVQPITLSFTRSSLQGLR